MRAACEDVWNVMSSCWMKAAVCVAFAWKESVMDCNYLCTREDMIDINYMFLNCFWIAIKIIVCLILFEIVCITFWDRSFLVFTMSLQVRGESGQFHAKFQFQLSFAIGEYITRIKQMCETSSYLVATSRSCSRATIINGICTYYIHCKKNKWAPSMTEFLNVSGYVRAWHLLTSDTHPLHFSLIFCGLGAFEALQVDNVRPRALKYFRRGPAQLPRCRDM